MRRIILIARDLSAPSFRLRLASLTPLLESRGWQVRRVEVPGRPEWLRIATRANQLKGSDLVVISKLKLLAGERALLRHWSGGLVWDVDDAVMYAKPRSLHSPVDRSGWRRRRFARMAAHTDLVVAGSRHLATMIGTGPQALEVLPTPVDLGKYPVGVPGPERPELILGWIGLGANLRYLELLGPVLRALADGGLRYELRVICDRPPALHGVPWRLIPWTIETEGLALAELQIGLAPLSHDLWTEGKGGYRCIQYAAAGIPTVASPVGANTEVVLHGKTGLWADSLSDWVAKLRNLAGNPSLRGQLGGAARQRATDLYDIAYIGPRYCCLLDRVLHGVLDRHGAPATVGTR